MALLSNRRLQVSASHRGFAGFALCTLAAVGCRSEPRFPFEVAKRATALRISHAEPGVRTRVREINNPAVLRRVLDGIDQFDNWEVMPECRTGTCNDITIEWVVKEQSPVRMSLCNLGHRARVGGQSIASPCGRHVPVSASAALLKELGE
jgi:hypothetical protein